MCALLIILNSKCCSVFNVMKVVLNEINNNIKSHKYQLLTVYQIYYTIFIYEYIL